MPGRRVCCRLYSFSTSGFAFMRYHLSIRLSGREVTRRGGIHPAQFQSIPSARKASIIARRGTAPPCPYCYVRLLPYQNKCAKIGPCIHPFQVACPLPFSPPRFSFSRLPSLFQGAPTASPSLCLHSFHVASKKDTQNSCLAHGCPQFVPPTAPLAPAGLSLHVQFNNLQSTI